MNPQNIFQTLRDKIIWLEIEPESLLKIADLENEFGVSRTPIKEALIQLRAEEWVFGEGSQFVVTPLSMARFRELTEIRTILEVNANVLAMNRISNETLEVLAKQETEHHQFTPETTIRQIAEADFNFHCLIYNATNNKQLAQQLTKLLAQNIRFWLSIPRIVEPEGYHKDVREIIDSIRNKDEKRLRDATFAHIQWAADAIISYF